MGTTLGGLFLLGVLAATCMAGKGPLWGEGGEGGRKTQTGGGGAGSGCLAEGIPWEQKMELSGRLWEQLPDPSPPPHPFPHLLARRQTTPLI